MAIGDKLVKMGVFKTVLDNVRGHTRNLFNPAVFAAADNIELDGNGYWTGTGEAFALAFSGGVPGLVFEAGKQYYFAMTVYTDANASESAGNGLNVSFYSGETRIGRKSILNNVTEPVLAELVSTAGSDVTSLAFNYSNVKTNIWHIKDVMLIASALPMPYVPYNTAYDATSREDSGNSVHLENVCNLLCDGGYINLNGKRVGDTVTDLTPVSSTTSRYLVTDVQAGDAFILTTAGGSAARPFAFIDADSVITQIATGSMTRTDEVIVAPAAGKMIVNSFKSGSFSLHRIAGARTAEGLMETYYIGKDRMTHRWRGKKIVTFGDSRTWYDKQIYTENTKPELVGSTCVGYQEQMRNLMMADVVNQGASGETSAEICARILAFNFTGYDGVLLEGGVNDFVKSAEVTIGEIAPIGSTFDTGTVYGAWQAAVEYMLNNYPGMQIYLTIPAIAWTNAGLFPYDIAKIKGEIAALYNLPCVDLYKGGGINELNRDNWYCDDVQATGWRLHFNDAGNALLGAKIAEFMISK